MAPARCSAGTIVGGSERPAGAPRAAATPVRPARARNAQRDDAPAAVTAIRPTAAAASNTRDTATTRFREKRSEIWPAGSASRSRGTNSKSPTRPRSNALPLIA
jgi:hypothetical protein